MSTYINSTRVNIVEVISKIGPLLTEGGSFVPMYQNY